MTYNQLIEKGAIEIKPLKIYPAREKAWGRMWSGEAILQLGKIIFKFNIWHHGPNNSFQAYKEIKEQTHPDLISLEDKSFDAYWYTVQTKDSIWLHPQGWFRDDNLNRIAEDLRENFNEDFAKQLGFVKLV